MRCTIELDFRLVDDVCFACEGGGFDISRLPQAAAGSLGPLLELEHIAPTLNGSSLTRHWLEIGAYKNILVRRATLETWYNNDDSQGLIGVSRLQSEDLAWTDLVHRVRRAATKAGFSGEHSGKIASAMLEIYGNVIDHSRSISSGYVAYSAAPGRFEFVVADRGIGVLESLRSNPAFVGLRDSGDALEHALAEGVSRYDEAGHGYGFRPLLIGLTNLSRTVRFRSGDHGHTLMRDASRNIGGETRPGPKCPGFFCSVLFDLG